MIRVMLADISDKAVSYFLLLQKWETNFIQISMIQILKYCLIQLFLNVQLRFDF